MEEERIQFSRMIKDARRRVRDFLLNIDKSSPFILDKVARSSLNKNGVTVKQETNKVCYKRLSCSYEKSEDEMRLATTRKARSFSKRNRPNHIKKRFRHSVIGNGNEFSDLDEALLLDVLDGENEADRLHGKTSSNNADFAFTKYLSELYSSDVTSRMNGVAARVKKSTNREIPVADLLQIDNEVSVCTRQKDVDINKSYKKSLNDDLTQINENYEEYVLPDEIPDFFEHSTRLHSAEISNFSSVNRDDSQGVAYSREQKRRLKRKMKQALRKPENYFYMGNL